ncbi:MAG TPA: helix-turn-helix domain-containing protein [Thermoanaerobaculia bacterium]
MPRHTPQLISDLIALTASWGWTVADLAKELGVDRSTLLHYRSGRRALTVRMLSRIARRFGDRKLTRDLVWHHLLKDADRDQTPSDERSVVLPPLLDLRTARALRAYLDRFADETIHSGRGLFLSAASANQLSDAANYVIAIFTTAKVPVCRLRADRNPAASERRAALAAALLVVERVDFACDATREILRHRADLVRPIIVTSLAGPAQTSDLQLRRVYNSMMRRIEIGVVEARPEPVPSPTSHAV